MALLSPDGNGTGNRSTSRRIARHLETAGYRVVPINACAGGDDGPRSAVLEAGAAAAIGVHGFRSGRHLIAIGVPYAIVFGGTDLSDPKYHRGDAGRIIGAAVSGAAALVAFSSVMRDRALQLWPDGAVSTQIIPQAVAPLDVDRTFRFRAYLHEHCRAAAGPAWESDLVRILLLPAGIRPVKDVCFVAAAVSAWHRSFPAVRLVIVGPVLDEAYCNDVRHSLKDLSGVYLVPSLSAPQLYAAIQSSCAVINTSISEGQCGVILEAMALGIAVIAREIPQNAALIVHGENGLLFDTPEEFVRVAASLMEDGGLVSKLTTGGLEYVASVHSMESEHASYVDLAGRLTMTS